ncbi:DUF721 domain-containing protein [Salinispira pacifica]|uniref:DUF721 domain-containing protein n=1 Tax=Salinispira pacifica TaxID=1307761 RepID=V5WCW7_9SPIO|nr:DUF721 domain-containing protein [Salinispira pacifica]AHC13450.1 hypothetical protein L21SP2_0004 [Salinispira pacifica]
MKKADEIIKAFIPMINSREGADYLDLFSSWSSILGEGLEDIAAHTEPVDIKNGALILYVDHPGWMQKLEFRKSRLLRILKKKYPELGIHSVFIQKVSNERFLERREARMMGNSAASASPPASGTRENPAPRQPENTGQSRQDAEQKEEQDTGNEGAAAEKYDPRFADTLRRFAQLSKKAPKK